jgi:rfaE bifunctional protein nucleotidyltransferase chain/domain
VRISPEDKLCFPAYLQHRLRELPRPLVMTNSVFDILHRGHVDYLHRAAQLGASLLVAVNTDVSARLLGKGHDRPLNKDLDRAYILAGLSAFSMVTFFKTRTPVGLIEAIQPDVYDKGGD